MCRQCRTGQARVYRSTFQLDRPQTPRTTTSPSFTNGESAPRLRSRPPTSLGLPEERSRGDVPVTSPPAERPAGNCVIVHVPRYCVRISDQLIASRIRPLLAREEERAAKGRPPSPSDLAWDALSRTAASSFHRDCTVTHVRPRCTSGLSVTLFVDFASRSGESCRPRVPARLRSAG